MIGGFSLIENYISKMIDSEAIFLIIDQSYDFIILRGKRINA